MNDETPRAFTGSLLERAAARWEFAPAPPVQVDPVPAAAAPQRAVPVLDLVDPLPPFGAPLRHAVTIDRTLLAESGMIVPGAAVTSLAEEFRLIKRQLLLTAGTIADAGKARAILVCSAKPDDGKTFCAINLALSLAAEPDREIVLVDADFAKPDVLATLGVEARGPGLLDAIRGNALDVEDLILPTDVPHLSILPAGTRSHSDTELLGSARAAQVLQSLSAADPRRILVFDSPPALAASPAAVLAGHVGQVLLVVRADVTVESDLRAAVALLDGCDQVQLVLNAVAFEPGGRRFGSYYGQEQAA
ncbi:exopolysaccharide/PEP-CTERM locus tyrosine autokinase [Sphingomonas guangdongensis]|uniref:Exopolysaccharide/PEP-CTERM locus tyrosine autokinase n=1 Tax=Sphingomonas guangdongensis TaxID=1141890 RepID=A0A285R1A3_9SPHN|nr:exopolysaccharide biosynthesis protein [Sphingomonas guangdongensis]SOB87604.1 exopolysaccharide/PEP-CTERM locus tyrosine autokinase [Sphingomonas guangdongensis]